MGKWLAEFQENTLETGEHTTDSTDTSCDLSVLSVHNQGVLEEKTHDSEMYSHNSHNPQNSTDTPNIANIENIANGVLALIKQACEGFEITPDQFITLTTKEDRELILSGDLPLKVLRAYAKSFAEGIQTGRITFHPTFNHGIPSTKQYTDKA